MSSQVSFNQILQDLGELFQNAQNEYEMDANYVLQCLSDKYEQPPNEILRQGFRKAYRQLVEGL